MITSCHAAPLLRCGAAKFWVTRRRSYKTLYVGGFNGVSYQCAACKQYDERLLRRVKTHKCALSFIQRRAYGTLSIYYIIGQFDKKLNYTKYTHTHCSGSRILNMYTLKSSCFRNNGNGSRTECLQADRHRHGQLTHTKCIQQS